MKKLIPRLLCLIWHDWELINREESRFSADMRALSIRLRNYNTKRNKDTYKCRRCGEVEIEEYNT